MAANRFCTNCGTPLGPGGRFCGSCGHPVTPAASTTGVPPVDPTPSLSPVIPPPPPPSSYSASVPPVFTAPAGMPAEKLLGVVPAVSRKKGIMAVEGFNFIFTDKRIIFALMTNEMIKEEVQRVSKGAGFFGGIAAAATVGSTFYKRYLTMAPEAALVENSNNFSVNLSSIRRVKIEEGKELNTYAGIKANQGSMIKRHQYENGNFELETGGETLKFELPGSSLDMAVGALKKAGLYR